MGEKFNRDMSFNTAKKIINFAKTITPLDQVINIGFFGGEPLLCYDLIKKIIDFSQKGTQIERVFLFSITTNGTLLGEHELEYFKSQKVDLCISIDGPARIHDLNRSYKNGRGSFNRVLQNLRLALDIQGFVQVNAVYCPKTFLFLPTTISFFKKLGISSIHLNPDICATWKESDISKLGQSYMKVANEYIQSYENGNEIAINIIDSKIILLLKGGYGTDDVCGMAETEWAFAPSGNIYPCERFIGEDNDPTFCLGNIHTGLNQNNICSILKHRGNKEKRCQSCKIQSYCMNWCGCTNYYTSGYTDTTGKLQCESEKALMKAAKHVLITLKDNDLFLDHFLKYIHEEHYLKHNVLSK